MRSSVFRKFVLCSIFAVALCIVYSINGTALASCDEYLKEAEAVEGVVPRFNDDGTIRAFVIFGEGTFLAAKRSLISKARRKAELRAKRAFSEWMKESLQSESVVADMMEQEENTDDKGNTSGKVKEVTSNEFSPGNYKFQVNASDLSSGIYFVELINGVSAQYLKIILLK